MNTLIRKLITLGFATALTACSGGNTASTGTPPHGPASAERTAKILFTIAVPPQSKLKARRPNYVSPATAGIVINIAGPTPISETVGLTPTSTGCTSRAATTTCELSVNVAPGNYTATLTTYDHYNGGSVSGNVLSTAQNVAFVAVANGTTNVPLTLSGVPANLVAVPLTPFTQTGTTQGINLLGLGAHAMLLEALDADGNAIVGPGAPTLSMAQSGALVLTLVQPTTQAPNLVSLTPPNAFSTNTATLQITASYAGQATDGCAQTGAVCSVNVAVNMQQMIAAVTSSALEYFAPGESNPFETITAGLDGPAAVVADSSGDVFVLNQTNGNVVEYPVTQTSPLVAYSGVFASAATFDVSGDLFLASATTKSVTEYAPGSSTPTATITNGIHFPLSVVCDPLGRLYVANTTPSVTEYDPPFTNPPVHTITTGLLQPRQVVLAPGASPELYVPDSLVPAVVGFPYDSTTSNGSTTGPSPLTPFAVTFDPFTNLAIASSTPGTGAVYTYLGSGIGNNAPTATVTSGINSPQKIVFDATDELYVVNGGSGSVTAYPFALNARQQTLVPPGSNAVDVTIVP